MNYIIDGTIFTNIANAIRTQDGSTDAMTPVDMPSKILNLNPTPTLKIKTTEGIELPDISIYADLLKDICFIRKNTPTGYYDFYICPFPLKLSSTIVSADSKTSRTCTWYRCSIEAPTEWTLYSETQSVNIIIDDSRQLVWTNNFIGDSDFGNTLLETLMGNN